jgi:hypothetical protein
MIVGKKKKKEKKNVLDILGTSMLAGEKRKRQNS